MRELEELSNSFNGDRNKTVLHQIAIEMELLKDDNFIFQYDFTDCGIWGSNDSYAIVTPTNDTLIRIPKDVKELDRLPYKIVQKLNEHGFKTDLITK